MNKAADSANTKPKKRRCIKQSINPAARALLLDTLRTSLPVLVRFISKRQTPTSPGQDEHIGVLFAVQEFKGNLEFGVYSRNYLTDSFAFEVFTGFAFVSMCYRNWDTKGHVSSGKPYVRDFMQGVDVQLRPGDAKSWIRMGKLLPKDVRDSTDVDTVSSWAMNLRLVPNPFLVQHCPANRAAFDVSERKRVYNTKKPIEAQVS